MFKRQSWRMVGRKLTRDVIIERIKSRNKVSQKVLDLGVIFEKQLEFQSKLNGDDVRSYPRDDVKNYSANMLLMLEELGELLKEDKRWRTFRGSNYDQKNKSSEIADVLIILLNVCMYSDISSEELYASVEEKIKVNTKRLEKK